MQFDAVLIEPRRAAMTAAGYWLGKTSDDYFAANLAANPDATALCVYTATTGASERLTWAELDRMADRCAIGLRHLGVTKGDVVCCQLPNGWQFVATFLGCSRIGAVFNPVMHILRERELSFMLAHGEVKVFIVPKWFNKFDHEHMAGQLQPSLPDLQHIVVEGGDGPNSFSALLANPAFDAERATIGHDARFGPDDVVQLVYTSGTTGEPKGAMHTSNTMFSNLKPFAERLHLSGSDAILMASPMAHQTGFMYGLLLPLMLGARAVLMDSWNKALAADVVEREGITWTMASTPFLMDLTNAVEESGRNTGSLRTFLCAGTVIPGPVVERAQRVLGAKVISAWGMTENGAVTTVRPEDPDDRSALSDGCPLPGVELEIRAADGTPVAAGTEGDIYVRACSVFGGYLKRPQLNGMDANHWFNTGDRGRLDAAGYIRITGRSKDIIIRGGENIPVVEVEAELYKHPAIAQVAVVAYPDDRLGERACAVVVLKPGQALTLADLQVFLEGRGLTRQYWPERLEVRDALPMTASGKIQKFALRQMVRAAVASA
jgi:cyclohexanecarboxylate-CoA ligase